MADKFAISFEQAIANENAPDEIEIYILPAALSREDISSGCYLEDEDNAYYPFWEKNGDNRPTDGKIQTVFVEWSVDGRQISFSQMTAKTVKAGKPVLNYHVQQNPQHTVSQETIRLGEYEVFCITTDFSDAESFSYMEEPVCRMWFWTDGDYLYRLDCSPGFSREEILKIFESLAPVEDINIYLGIG